MSNLDSSKPYVGGFGNGVFCTVSELFFEGRKSKGSHLHLRRKSNAHRASSRRSSIRGRGMEFFESRPYVLQDEIRNIDWKVSARLNGVYTKIFIEERDRPIFIVIDLRRTMFFGSVNCFKSVLAARIAARIATAAINGGDHLGGLTFNDHKETESLISGGKKSLARFLGILSQATMESDSAEKNRDAWSAVVKRVINRLHPGSVVFLVSDFFGLDEKVTPFLHKLKTKADVFALSISDPLEEVMPSIGAVGMSFGDDEIIFDTDDKELQKRYCAWRKNRLSQINSLFSSLSIPVIDFSTGKEIDYSLRKLFSGRW